MFFFFVFFFYYYSSAGRGRRRPPPSLLSSPSPSPSPLLISSSSPPAPFGEKFTHAARVRLGKKQNQKKKSLRVNTKQQEGMCCASNISHRQGSRRARTQKQASTYAMCIVYCCYHTTQARHGEVRTHGRQSRGFMQGWLIVPFCLFAMLLPSFPPLASTAEAAQQAKRNSDQSQAKPNQAKPETSSSITAALKKIATSGRPLWLVIFDTHFSHYANQKESPRRHLRWQHT